MSLEEKRKREAQKSKGKVKSKVTGNKGKEIKIEN